MLPPRCFICKKRFDPIKEGEPTKEGEGDIIYFKMRPSDHEWEKMMEEKGITDHPPYAAWFCHLHYKKVKELEHLTIDEARKILKF